MVQQSYYQRPGHLIAAAVILPVLDTVAVALRFFARRKQRIPLKTDDWLLIPATILTLGLGAAVIVGVEKHALGYPTPIIKANADLAPRSDLNETNEKTTISSQIEYAFYLMSILALGCVKLSFIFLYRRIFCVDNNGLTGIITMVMITITTGWTISFFIAHVFACGIHWSAWWGSVVSLMTHCVKTLDMVYALSMTDAILDVIIILIPLPLVWRLHMRATQRLALSVVFLLGGVAIAASISRLYYIAKVVYVGFDPHADEDLTITTTIYWGMIECGLGLVAACLPTLRPLVIGVSLESIVASLRSTFSLTSLNYRTSQGENSVNRPSERAYRARDDASLGSETPIVGNVPKAISTHDECYELKERVHGVV